MAAYSTCAVLEAKKKCPRYAERIGGMIQRDQSLEVTLGAMSVQVKGLERDPGVEDAAWGIRHMLRVLAPSVNDALRRRRRFVRPAQ